MIGSENTAQPTPAPLNVLLVEDEPADAYLVQLAFQESQLDIELQRVVDGREALSYLRKEPPFAAALRPGLILLDLNMPGMSGLEFLSVIKADKDLKRLPVVILTTSDSDKDIAGCYEMGASGYITKPIDIDRFIQVIKGLGDYWLNILKKPH